MYRAILKLLFNSRLSLFDMTILLVLPHVVMAYDNYWLFALYIPAAIFSAYVANKIP
jgi:hypothetical protein